MRGGPVEEKRGEGMRGDLLAILAREKLGRPKEWTVYRWQCLPGGGEDTTGFELEGAIQIGPRKWSKEGRAVVVFSIEEAQALALQWEQRTGYCVECLGRGQTVARISVTEGTTYRECASCGGTGKSGDFPLNWQPWVKPEPLFPAKPQAKKSALQARIKDLESDVDALSEQAETPTRRALREIKQFTGAWVG